MCKSEAKNAYMNTQIQVHSHLHTRKPTQEQNKEGFAFPTKTHYSYFGIGSG